MVDRFRHYGAIPDVCIHTPEHDNYSDMFIPRDSCACGNTTWKNGTIILGHTWNGDAIIKDVHRCTACNEVRFADKKTK